MERNQRLRAACADVQEAIGKITEAIGKLGERFPESRKRLEAEAALMRNWIAKVEDHPLT